jgi:hypothetical protein
MDRRSRWVRSLPLFVALGVLAVVLSRCGQNYPSAPAGSFRDVYDIVKKSNCNECHVPTGAAWKEDGVRLDFGTAKDAYSTLTKNIVTGKSSKTICKDVKIVTPGKVDKSYFLAVLDETVYREDFAGKKGCSPYATHLTDTNLSDAQKSSIRKWIENGAKDD